MFAISASHEEHKKPVVDKAEATALALGIAKLMKIKPGETKANDSSEASTGEIVSKHLDADFSCFLCRKKCRTRARFLLHFKRHFNKANRGQAAARGPTDNNNSSSSSSDENEGRDLENEGVQIHLRGLSETGSKRRRPPRSHGRRRHPIHDQDGDSGCHSAGDDGGSSSNGELTSDCPGDSEESSSDSDSEMKKSQQLEKCVAKRKNQQSQGAKANSGTTLKERLSLAEKQLDNNDTESLLCMTCLKRFSNCQNLRRHLRLHIARDSIKPDYEDDEGEVEEDSLENSGEGPASQGKGRFLCDWCPLRFDNRSAARIHEATHKGQEPKCYVCSKQYADRYSLRYHLRTHGIGRQIRCEYCSKAFSKPSRLAAHVRSHHKNIRDFSCPSCDKSFKTRVHLNNHFRQHSGEKPFECPVCHETFRHKASMLSHARSHDGQRPYCCEICGKTFREPSTLKAHSRVHTGDKPYTCLDCGKSFTQRAGLNYHRKASHEGVKPHSCRLCPFSTVKAASLTAHYRNIHHEEASSEKASETSTAAASSPDLSLVTEEACPTATTPLPSFDNLKTSHSNMSPTASPAPLTPPSSSPSSSSTTSTSSACLEDFLPQTNPAGSNSANAEFLPSLSVSELANHLEYGTYDYPNYRHPMYAVAGPEQVQLPNQQIMHHASHLQHQQQQQQQHHHHHHHHPQQSHQHQWFSYASSQQHHEMINGGNGNANAATNASTYNYAGGSNYPYFNAAATSSTNAGGTSGAYMGFSGGSNDYDNTYSHPSYCI